MSCYHIDLTDNHFHESRRLNFDLLLEADRHHGGLDLVGPRPLEPEVEAVVGQAADLLVVTVVAHANHGDLGMLEQKDQLGHATPVLVAGHSVDLVHQDHSLGRGL